MRNAASLAFIALLPLLAGGPVASAQSFTFTAQQTSLSDTLGAEIVFHGSFTNVSPLPLTLMFVRTVNALPSGWESSLCFDACFPSWIDTIVTTSDYGSSPVQPSETRSFSLHVYPMVTAGTGYARVLALDTRTPSDSIGILFAATAAVVGVAGSPPLPHRPALDRNYPNPFNASTTLQFTLVDRQSTVIRVLDLLGRTVTTLVDDVMEPGMYRIRWDAGSVSGGVYVCELTAGPYRATRLMLLLR